jgi:hypothetical protein
MTGLEASDPRRDLRWGVADRVVAGEDPAEQRDDVAAQRGEGDDRGPGAELQASRGGVEGDDDRDNSALDGDQRDRARRDRAW